MAGKFRIEIGTRYRVTTGFKKEFEVRALDANGDWFEAENGERFQGSRLLILESHPNRERTLHAGRDGIAIR